MEQIGRRVAEPGFGDGGHQAVSNQEQGGGTPDATPVHHCQEDQNEQEQRNDRYSEPALVKVDSEPVIVDRQAVEGLVG